METKLKVKLLRYTSDPEDLIATAARLCYSKADIDELFEKMTHEKSVDLLKKLIELGHESPTEHAIFTFAIEGVSRALTHQLVRHRIASYSQQSQRYVKGSDFKYIIPPSIKKNKQAKDKFEKLMQLLAKEYDEFNKIAPNEDARFVLPNAAETKIIVTMNARSLKNFFIRRCCERAQWEIRTLADEMLKLCRKVAPNLFGNIGPNCYYLGYCTEGKMTCGKAEEIKEKYKNLK